MKRYIVTGGAGFIGSHLAKRLVGRGDEVYILDDLSTGFLHNIPDGANFHRVDVSDSDEVARLILPEKIDCFYHFGAQSSGEASFDDPGRDIEVNYLATHVMLRLAQEKRADRFIYSSSMSVYGEADSPDGLVSEDHPCRPVSYYGCNKLASEKMIEMFVRYSDIKPTIFRFFSVYGPGQNMRNLKQGMLSIYLSYIMKDNPIVVKGSLNRFRDFIYIDDLIDAVIRCEDSPLTHNRTFNLGSGKKTMVSELLAAILRAFGKADFDSWVVVGEDTLGNVTGVVADIRELKAAVDWRPKFSIDEGIGEMKRWIDKTIDLWKD